MSDRIELREVRAWGRHGANAGEQDVVQPIDLDLTLELDLHAAGASDRLADTVDYAALHGELLSIVGNERCALLERLGERILDAVFRDGRVRAASVTLAKPQLLGGATPAVTLVRRR